MRFYCVKLVEFVGCIKFYFIDLILIISWISLKIYNVSVVYRVF